MPKKKPQEQTKQVQENIYETLLPSTEPKIDMLNVHWKKINSHIEEYTNYDQKTYLVDNNIFSMTLEQLEKFKYPNDDSYKVYRFYKLSDSEGLQHIIFTTSNSIYSCFCADVINNLKVETSSSKFETFKKAGSKEIYVIILKIIRTKMTKGIKAELDTIKKELENQNGIVIPTVIDKSNLEPKTIEIFLKNIGRFNQMLLPKTQMPTMNEEDL
jgi:hypothetical protein